MEDEEGAEGCVAEGVRRVRRVRTPVGGRRRMRLQSVCGGCEGAGSVNQSEECAERLLLPISAVTGLLFAYER